MYKLIEDECIVLEDGAVIERHHHAALAALSLDRLRNDREPDTWDYTSPCWGHAIATFRQIEDTDRVKAIGWGPIAAKSLVITHAEMQCGDLLRVSIDGSDGSVPAVFEILRIAYENDPKDMWHAELRLIEIEDQKANT